VRLRRRAERKKLIAQPDLRFAFALALRLGCTVEELGQRMSALEFGQWITFFEHEQLHPAADRMRHAQQLAAAHNGPLSRRDGAHWAASMFMPPNPWAPPQAQGASEPAPPTAQQLADQVAALNARMD
jgi:predicted TIM-barrel fold metal-dependent hydrolase